MAHNDFKRYVWLIALLYNTGGASLKEINEAWQGQANLNPDGKSLPQRTFNNHRSAIQEIFGLTISCNKKGNNYKYWISDDLYSGRMLKLMLLMSSITIWDDKDSYDKLATRILYEKETFVYPEHIQSIISAMSRDKMISLDYKKYGNKIVSRRKLAPFCLKMFKRRWYLLAREKDALKTFCLDGRTIHVKVLDDSFEYPSDFSPEAYFKDTYGILTSAAQEVKLKAYGQEADYLRSTPIHPSQEETEKGPGYSIFTLYVGTNAWDFHQELLSRGDRLEVLSPSSLRKDIATHIERMRTRYA